MLVMAALLMADDLYEMGKTLKARAAPAGWADAGASRPTRS